MNLLGLMKEEISNLNLTDKLKIKDYLYYRTGEIFNYDPLYMFSDPLEREELKKIRIDKENVTTFSINCFTWAYLFVDLLCSFLIPASVKFTRGGGHAYVEAYIDGETYLLDLMANYEDIKRIKFGMDVCYNIQISHNRPFKVNNENNFNYNNKNKMEEMLKSIHMRLQLLKLKNNNEEYVYIVFKMIEIVMNLPRENIGYIEGIKYISTLLQIFVSDEYKPKNTHFFDKENGVYIEAYSVPLKNGIKYFAYKQKDNVFYELHEITREEIEFYLENYSNMKAYNLSLQKNKNEY